MAKKDNKTVVMGLRLTPQMVAQLADLARKYDAKESDVLRQLIAERHKRVIK